MDLSAENNLPLVPGVYARATRYPFTPFAGLDVVANSRGCNELTGRFVVLEAVYAPNGTVQRFAADVEQHCEDADPGLFAAIRYNSTLDATPFGGAYPAYSLTVSPPVNGTIMGDGIACGHGQTACALTFTSPAHVTLTATRIPAMCSRVGRAPAMAP